MFGAILYFQPRLDVVLYLYPFYEFYRLMTFVVDSEMFVLSRELYLNQSQPRPNRDSISLCKSNQLN